MCMAYMYIKEFVAYSTFEMEEKGSGYHRYSKGGFYIGGGRPLPYDPSMDGAPCCYPC